VTDAELREVGRILVKVGVLTKAEVEEEGVLPALRRRYTKGKKTRAKKDAPADLEALFKAGTVAFKPLTRAGRDWLEENVHADVLWRHGQAFLVSREVGDEIIRAARKDLRVRAILG
jgi:hypothetical protein